MDNRMPTPGWQPIKNLPMIAQVIDNMLVVATTQYATLQEAGTKPLGLTDYTLKRIIKVFNTQQSDLWLFNGQLRHWKIWSPAPTPSQATEIERLAGQMLSLQQVATNIVGLAEQLSKNNNQKVLVQNENELVLIPRRKR